MRALPKDKVSELCSCVSLTSGTQWAAPRHLKTWAWHSLSGAGHDSHTGRPPLSLPARPRAAPGGAAGEPLGCWAGVWEAGGTLAPHSSQPETLGKTLSPLFSNTMTVHIPKSTIWETAHRSRPSILRQLVHQSPLPQQPNAHPGASP